MSIKLDQHFLDEKFKEYYKKHTITATHIFVFSKKQKKRSEEVPFMDSEFIIISTKVNGVEYTEMRSRDESQIYNFDDTKFLDVGTYNDINQKN